ncbi:MAG: site-specific DNA-methyltransferase, partial [Oligoflexus sp.]
MNSLLEYEGTGGQVQMIYFDPPYGVQFGSNFQPFIRKRDVKHGPDDQMIREPEMVKAYRDTWEIGLHSYLSYMRDRLLLAKDCLHESGSIFVQISDANLHHVRELLDDVFGSENFIGLIPFRKKTMPFGAKFIEQMADFILWYGKNKGRTKYHDLYRSVSVEGEFHHCWYESKDGSRHKMSKAQVDNHALLPSDVRVYRLKSLEPSGVMESGKFRYEFEGEIYDHPKNGYGTTFDGMKNLERARRLQSEGNRLCYIIYADESSYARITAPWMDTVGADNKVYVVQTNTEVVKRCILMTTDPGDLVMDITCGSGTTPVVAESWGRRWIACDTSRVPIALARQRLLTSVFDWYRLKDPSKGPSGGFVYERNRKGFEVGGLIPKVTLGSIANGEDPSTIRIVDRPEQNNSITRVCGPFTVEATIQAAMNLEDDSGQQPPHTATDNPRGYLDRMIELLRQSKTLQLPGNVTLQLDAINPLADREYLHAEGVAKNGTEKRIAFVFGPEDGAIGSEYVFNAHTEALQQGFQQLFLFGFAIQAKAREMLDKLKVPTTYVAVTPDVVMSDLLKTTKSSEICSITGLPDVLLESAGKAKDGTPLHRVVIKGLDIFRPDTMETEEVKAENLPCWMLDSN